MVRSLLKNILLDNEEPSPEITLISGVVGLSISPLLDIRLNSAVKLCGSKVFCITSRNSQISLHADGQIQCFYHTYEEGNDPFTTAAEAIQLQNKQQTNSACATLVIDGLQDLLLTTPLPSFLRTVRQLVDCHNSRVVLACARDALHACQYRAVRHIARAVIAARPPATSPLLTDTVEDWPENTRNVCCPLPIAKVCYRKPSGKLLQSTEAYRIDSSNGLSTSPLSVLNLTPAPEVRDRGDEGENGVDGAYIGGEDGDEINGEDEGNTDPFKGVPFNLFLNESEKEAKKKVVLPFTRAKQPVTTSVIHYTHDQQDWDEDDPDDDLDI